MEATLEHQHHILKERKHGMTIHRVKNFTSSFLDSRFQIDIYLPPDYDASNDNPFPVLFFNDGQDMPRVRLTQTLHQLYLQEKIPSIIIVAIHAADRLHEYGTSKQADYKGRGNKADGYAQFIATEVLPFIKEEYPITSDPSKTAFAGFSLGGLSALDIVWHYSYVFQSVGVFSGALWWRHTLTADNEDPDAYRIVHEMMQQDRYRSNLRFWFQTGTMDEKEDRNNNGVIDAIDDTLDLISILKQKGYPNQDIHYREVENGIHHPATWGMVMPEFLEWCFGERKTQNEK